jgi:Xaa-Pro aminopeptidase
MVQAKQIPVKRPAGWRPNPSCILNPVDDEPGGGNYHGHIGDLARMVVLGEPDQELKDLLAEIEAVQRGAFAVIKLGAMGGVLHRGRTRAEGDPPARQHRVPRPWHGPRQSRGAASDRIGSRALYATDVERPLEPGMVISVETTVKHPKRGFIKFEDTVAVTATAHEIFGEGGRGWNVGGTAVR